MSEGELAGKRVLVVGGETVLGRAVLIGLAEAGADVAIASLTADKKAEFAINSALNELWALGRKGVALPIDASDAEQVRGAVEQADRELGAVDLVVAAGTVASEALTGRELIEMAADAEPGEALSTISERLIDIAGQG